MTTRIPLAVSAQERAVLDRLVRLPSTSQALASRCKAVLLDDAGWTYAAIAAELGMREQTVLKWRQRFLMGRVAGLSDMLRPGVRRRITNEQIAEVVRKTLEDKPPDATHWSVRSMAVAAGISRSTVHTIWKAFKLQPHRF